jgi:hypothetical protein
MIPQENAVLARSVAVVGLAGVALIHVLDAHDTFVSAPYKGWLYLALIIGCLAAAGRLLNGDDSRTWLAAGLLPLGAFVAFVVSRTVGLPNGADDIGNWWEPLGLASLFAEGSLVLLSSYVLYLRHVATMPRNERTALQALRAR